MKGLIAGFFLLVSTAAFAQTPDPRDSIILESKSVAPGERGAADTSAYLYVKVYITNKDSLSVLGLALQETSTSGGAYAILGRPRSFAGVITNLSTLRYGTGLASVWYHSDSPDSFAAVALSDGVDPSTNEPPNAVRKAIWEIKFDSVLSNAGTFELDTVRTAVGQYTVLGNTAGQDVPFNFVKSVITVYPKGDFNQDLGMSAADVVLLINCVFGGQPLPVEASCDVNCDGQASGADVVLEVNAVFNQEPFPC